MNIIYYFLSIIILKIHLIESYNDTYNGIRIQIFDNIAEISRPISPFDLPITYTQQEWNDIRSDSFRLIGDYVNIQGQIISYNRTSLNGQKIFIQRSLKDDKYTEAIMIDETRYLILDLIDNTYYTITSDRIRYLSIPPVRNYFVNFIFHTSHVEQLYLRYLQNNIKWKVRYDLLLETNDNDSILQAYADIRNDGSSLLIIDSAELISGDVKIQSTSSSSPSQYYNNNGVYAAYEAAGGAANLQAMPATTTTAPTISSSTELAGIYVFSINETFTLDSQSNFILPMFRPIIDIERYGLIDKYFRPMDNRGHARRAYRLRVPDTYLPKGQVFIRESNRLVGETNWLDHSANETNEFNLGEDPDLQYIEYVQLSSRRQAYEANGYRFVLSTYTINLHLINNKNRSINIEYRLKFSSQDNLTLKENTSDNLLQVDGSTISGIFQLNENQKQEIQFTVETQ
ncbi:unnamed protein product [Rotaria sp. Silwood2]|nr:unnamed protein product [Rotaria sp. Silwood2]CAF2513191.1 unnamed protein product [Rotaria sp. Silwood2]CAF2747963.1 unnamed protein product [Rotaria sp. Silwood2]CAF2892427.1 unnamed protein product [Rotaria sp. Silwood2]CAF3879339.1 unnamed protein product [Rotaria sp. Silwood2]